MKHIRVNEQPIDVTLEQTDTMQSIVLGIAAWSKQLNEYPIRLVIDGTEYALAQSDWQALALADIETIDIYTFSPHMLREYLPALNTISHLLQSGKKQEAMAIIFKTSLLISHMITIIPYIEGLDAGQAQAQIQTLTAHLTALQQSIENDDVVLIGDTIEYEIHEQLTRLLDMIP